jgi:hypothetical protein
VARRLRGPTTAAERFVAARDAYSSAILLSLFILLATVVALAGVRTLPWSLFRLSWIVRGTGAVLALAFLAATRDRPRARIACVLSSVQIVPLLALFPFLAAHWMALGRPCEVFVDLRLVLASLPLVATPSVRVGIALAVAFAGEAIAIDMWQRHVAMLPRLTDAAEPAASLAFAVASVALLGLRERRRRLTIRYLRVNSEATALERTSGQLDAVAREMEEPLNCMSAAFEQVRAAAPAAASVDDNTRHALAKLALVRERLAALISSTGSAATSDSPAVAPSAAEQLLHARDAQNSVMALAVIALVGGTVGALSVHRLSLGLAPVLWVLQGGVGLACLASLYWTRERPSVARSIALFLVLVLPYQAIFVYAQLQWSRLGVPYEPFWGHQAVMVVLTLATPRYLGLGIGLQLLFALEAVGLYYGLQLSSIAHLVPLGEPWQTLLFCAIGIAFLGIREQRRIASLRLLRREAEVAILLRRESLYMVLRDQINSPLQALTLAVGLLEVQNVAGPGVKAAADALKELTAVAQKLPALDETVPAEALDVAFDGSAELERIDRANR